MATRETGVIAAATSVLAVLAIVCALYFGRPVLEPIALGLLLSTLLKPIVDWLTARRVPAGAAATAVIIGVVTLIGAGAALAAGPLQSWIAKVPQTLAVSKSRLASIRAPFEGVSKALSAAELGGSSTGDSTISDSTIGKTDSAATRRNSDAVRKKSPAPAPAASRSESGSSTAAAEPSHVGTVLARLFGTTASVLSMLVEALLLALFILSAGNAWRRKLSQSTDSSRTERTTLGAVSEMERVVTRYLSVLALINVGQGIVVALVMWMLGLPSPAVWGLMTFFAEFIPYLGGLSMIVVLALAGLAAFSSPLRVLAPPLAYLLITTLQNSVVSPITYGRHLKLNPFAILVGVLFWWSLWGVGGAFLAVPFLAAAKIVSDRLPSLAPVARFLEE